MDVNHPKNKDLRPKRRKDKDNPYKLLTSGINTDQPHYYISFRNGEGNEIYLEVDKDLFTAMDQFELEDLAHLNEIDRHYEHSELTEESVNQRAMIAPETVEDMVLQKLQNEQLYKLILCLPEKQKRRLVYYYFGDFTYDQIARMEGCTKVAVKHSIDKAISTIRKTSKDFFA